MTGNSDGRSAPVDGSDAADGDPRGQLVEGLRAAWARSGLKQQSVEHRLRVLLRGQKVRGISDTALSRYLKPTETALPAAAVLSALADVFEVGAEESARWQELREQAHCARRRSRYQRTAPDRPAASPCEDPAEPRPAPRTGQSEATASAPATAAARAESGSSPRQDGRRRPSPRARTAALGAGVALGVVGAAIWNGERPVAEHTVPSRAVSAAPAQPAPAPSGTLEKGSLGSDSRCSVPFAGPEPTVWRVCARVTDDRVAFAVKITNPGPRPVGATVRVQYAHHREFHACPRASGAYAVTVPAGGTFITDPARCSVPRRTVYIAYQGVGWVVPAGSAAGSYELSPTAHVRSDRVIWQPDLLPSPRPWTPG
ncbi:helix-turn-helix transcriptional regulator [Streptomyces sp. NRRL S-340]|uniref:helix-turn-helix transcriptional regulator n=1 Tax=Streptomyces sp. NRRL S-340 TaxID=1463901 RepID=UPI00055EDE58|nr:helix-turn-helix transcriptional regulator [Streptomyces sp. NRRL S-340]